MRIILKILEAFASKSGKSGGKSMNIWKASACGDYNVRLLLKSFETWIFFTGQPQDVLVTIRSTEQTIPNGMIALGFLDDP